MTIDLGIAYALIGVGISVGLGAGGSAKGVGAVASAGAGLLSKEPKKFGQALVLAALPSTQALYGMLFGFIILINIGLLSGEPLAISEAQGLALMASALPVGLACFWSGEWQGKAAAAGMKILAEKPENLSQAIVLAALIETMAIFGLVVSLLITFVGIDLSGVAKATELVATLF